MKHTPGPWAVRTRENWGDDGAKVVDCFVTAPDVNGFPYGADILSDDEYRDESGGVERRLADCHLIAAAPELYAKLRALCVELRAQGIPGGVIEQYYEARALLDQLEVLI